MMALNTFLFFSHGLGIGYYFLADRLASFVIDSEKKRSEESRARSGKDFALVFGSLILSAGLFVIALLSIRASSIPVLSMNFGEIASMMDHRKQGTLVFFIVWAYERIMSLKPIIVFTPWSQCEEGKPMFMIQSKNLLINIFCFAFLPVGMFFFFAGRSLARRISSFAEQQFAEQEKKNG